MLKNSKIKQIIFTKIAIPKWKFNIFLFFYFNSLISLSIFNYLINEYSFSIFCFDISLWGYIWSIGFDYNWSSFLFNKFDSFLKVVHYFKKSLNKVNEDKSFGLLIILIIN